MRADPEKMRDDYFRFHRVQTEIRDMDPAYPVLKDVARQLELSVEQRLWLVLVYAAYYHLGSGLRAFQETSNPRWAGEAAMDLPCATERRGHWTRPRLRLHLDHIQRIARERGLDDYFLSGLHGCTPEDAWTQVQHRAGKIPGNGRWASFKTTELIKEVVGLDLAAPDMQHAHSSGPRHGLELLHEDLPSGNGPAAVAFLDKVSAQLVDEMRMHALKVSVETAETSLCDFHSMTRGRYYPGHDIDQMQLQLDAVPSDMADRAWYARRRVLPEAYLGEITGRLGIDHSARVHYCTTGRIFLRDRTGAPR